MNACLYHQKRLSPSTPTLLPAYATLHFDMDPYAHVVDINFAKTQLRTILSCHGCCACRRIGRLDPGQYFGEVSCWTSARRTASVVAITAAELFSLERVSLLALAADWPEITQELQFKVPDERSDEHRAPLLSSDALALAAHACSRLFAACRAPFNT